MVEAPGEAEATCAALCSAGLVRAVATSDGDALLYGAERVYQVIKLKARRPWVTSGSLLPVLGTKSVARQNHLNHNTITSNLDEHKQSSAAWCCPVAECGVMASGFMRCRP